MAFDGQTSFQYFAKININGVDISREAVHGFEWKSFVNGGYEIRGLVNDVGHRRLNAFRLWTKDYLQKARKDPVIIKFKIGYFDRSDSDWRTNNDKEQIAVLTDLYSYGEPGLGRFEFVAIDPPSWYLNAGKSEGKVFTGNISEVIKDVVKQSGGGAIKSVVSDTTDDKKGKWAMMRQDPKTFILSLMDWSSLLTKNSKPGKAIKWMVGTFDETIYIQDQIDYLARSKHIGDFSGSNSAERRNDIMSYGILNSTMVTAYQTRLVTQGISAVSGKFIDKQTHRDRAEIQDENTSKKLNAKNDSSRAFAKPNKEYSTSIIAVPELNGGEIGKKYEEWIGGRPAQLYLDMLPMIMRVRFTLRGDPRFFDNSALGVSTIKITWKDIDAKDFFLSGRWIVYGFNHRMIKGEEPYWWTDVYAYRLDHDAASLKL